MQRLVAVLIGMLMAAGAVDVGAVGEPPVLRADQGVGGADGDGALGALLRELQRRELPGHRDRDADPLGAEAADEAGLNLGAVERTEVQTRLAALGYDPRGIDGKFGPGTRRAISAWQGDNGLTATGYLDRDQLARLRSQRRN